MFKPLHRAVEARDIDAIQRLLYEEDIRLYQLNSNEGPLWRTPLHLACVVGDLSLVRVLIDHGADAKAVDREYATPLSLAIRHKKFEIASALVKEFNCDPNACNKYGFPMIHTVFNEGDFEGVRFLVELGADVNRKNPDNDTLLSSAATKFCSNVETLLFLLEELKCDPNVSGHDGISPLHIACADNKPILAMNLIEHGAHLGSKWHGDTPLMLAVQKNNYDIVEMLLRNFGCDPDVADDNGMCPLHVACSMGNVDMVKLLASHSKSVNLTDRSADTPLIAAIRSARLDVVETLLDECSCHVNVRGKEDMTPLQIACCESSLPMVQVLINHGASVDAKGINCSPLVLAVRNDNDRVALALLEAGSDPNIVDEDGKSPLHIASSMGSHMVKYLATFGANLDARDANDDTPFSLAVAGEKDYVAQLLLNELKCDINTNNSSGKSPLHIACSLGNLSLVRDMVNHGADVLARDNDSNTPLTLAAWSEKYRIVLTLLDEFHCDPNVKGTRGMTLLHIFSRRGLLSMVQTLAKLGADSNIKDDEGNTAFLAAVKKEKLDIALALLDEFKCDPYATDKKGCSALQLALTRSHFSLVQALLDHGIEGFKSEKCHVDQTFEKAFKSGKYSLLLTLLKAFKSQCNPDVRDNQGMPLLHIACIQGNLSLVEALIESGADLNLLDKDSNTPLVLAVKNNVREVGLLLLGDSRCDPNIKGEHGMSPLHIACRNGNLALVCDLIKYGADPQARNNKDHWPLTFAVWNNQFEIVYELYKEYGSECDPNIVFSEEQTLLHKACGAGHLGLVQLLLGKGYDINAIDMNANTPLGLAVANMKFKVALFLLEQPVCRWDIANSSGMIPLHMAAENGSLDLVNVLATHVADVKVKDGRGATPLQIAVSSNRYDVALVLLQKCGKECDITMLYTNGQTILHKACIAGELHVVAELEKLGADFATRDDAGDTPLTAVIQEGKTEMAMTLLRDFKCDPTVQGKHGSTPLHLACKMGDLSFIRFLMERGASLTAVDSGLETPLSVAIKSKKYDAAVVLLEEFKCDSNMKGTGGETPLHIVCSLGKVELVHRLIKDFGADLHVRDDMNQTPLIKAVKCDRAEVVRSLISDYGCDVNMQTSSGTLLHLAATRGNVNVMEVLIKKFGMSVSVVDSSGNTPLHVAAKERHYEAAQCLLLTFHSPAYLRNELGRTAYDLADARIKSLFADSSVEKSVEADYKSMRELAKKRYSGSHHITRLFVIGHPGAGKSSLVEALKREGFFDSLYGRVSESTVPLHTAGIVPSVYTSEKYGRVQFYDFAGDPEYYSSHAAILERLFVSDEGTNICIIVLNLQESNTEIEKKYLYWSAFISHNSRIRKQLPSIIVVGSHVDLLSKQDGRSRANFVEGLASTYGAYHTFLPLDCCSTSSKDIKALRQLIHDISSKHEPYGLSYEESVLLGLLEKDFRQVTACPASTIIEHIRQVNLSHLPRSMTCLYPVLKQLQAIGALLILGDQNQDSYLVLNVSQLTNEVHEKLFNKDAAYLTPYIETFNIGLLPQSLLQEILPPYITKDCLVQLQYCQEVSHIDVGQDLSISQNPEEPAAPSKPLLYFPALCKLEKRNISWFLPPEDNFTIGWLGRCSSPHQYFPSRFLHVLLLRIAMRFTLVADLFPKDGDEEGASSHVHMKRRCQMWKTGVHWLSEEGVECEVDVDSSQEVVVCVRCEENSKLCLTVFNSIISCAMEAKAEFCHSIQLNFYLLNQAGSLSDDNLHRLEDVERILNEGRPKVISVRGDTWMSSSKLSHIRRTYWDSLFALDERLIIGYIETLVNEWFQLGEYLELPSNLLRAIETNFPHDVMRQKLEMVRVWLGGGHTRYSPCWWSLIKALREIGENVCAASILADQGEQVIDMQRKLLEPEFQCLRPDNEFLQSLSDVIGPKWPYLATLLSLTGAEIEDLREEREELSKVDQAFKMLKKWSAREGASYGQLYEKLRPVSLFQLSTNLPS